LAEQGSDGVDVLRNLSSEAFEAGPREVGESRCVVGMVDRTLVKNRLKMLYSIVQARDRLACHIFGK
jgi:hypothetical protein